MLKFSLRWDYQNDAIDWGDAGEPEATATFEELSFDQRRVVANSLGYIEYLGQVWYNPAELPADQFRLEFVEGSDYNNTEIVWSKVEVPLAGTSFDAFTYDQKVFVGEQLGYTIYTDDVYYDADNANKPLRTSFTIGVDYSNRDVPGLAGGLVNSRWVVSDGENEYMIYALDEEGDGIFDAIEIREQHKLFGQRGYGFLITGTISALNDNVALTFENSEAFILRGSINLLGVSSDLTLQSDTWVYLEGTPSLTGNLSIYGGVELDGTNLSAANAEGDSVWVDTTTNLLTSEAGTKITVMGGQDVTLGGLTLAGATLTEAGFDWAGPDSSIEIFAGEQLVVSTSIFASKDIDITTGVPGADDNDLSFMLTTDGGIVSRGVTTDGSGGDVTIVAGGNAQIMGGILSGGTSVDGIVTWGTEPSTIRVEATGQNWIGGETLNANNEPVEVGGSLQAVQRIDIIGGSYAPTGVGVLLPGSSRVVTNHPDSVISIESAQDAIVSAIMVAGGEIITYEDSRGQTLGSIESSFGGNSELYISAGHQILIGRTLTAGSVLDVRGGEDQIDGTSSTPIWEGQGLVLFGTARLSTQQENSVINLGGSGDVNILTSAWKYELMADLFAEFAQGDISSDVVLSLGINLGTHTLAGDVTLSAADTSDNTGLADLVADLNAAISSHAFEVIESASGSPAVGSTQTTAGLEVALGVGNRLMLRSDYAFTLKATSANYAALGFVQLSNGDASGIEAYTVDASQSGSVINIASEGSNGGEIIINGKLRGHSGINFLNEGGAVGAQDLNLGVSGLIETLSGGINFDLGTDGVLLGSLTARGPEADVRVNASRAMEIRGDIIAENDIIITAGTDIVNGETSIQTYGTSTLTTLAPDGVIEIVGLNDVVIGSIIGEGNSQIERIHLESIEGTLILDKDSGQIKTGGLLYLAGRHINIAGVIESTLLTPDLTDYEVTLSAKESLTIDGTITLAGSMKVISSENIQFANVRLIMTGVGRGISIESLGDILIGNTAPVDGDTAPYAAVLQADAFVEIIAGGDLIVGSDGQIFSAAADSYITLKGNRVVVIGMVMAGASFHQAETYAWTGARGQVTVESATSVVLGGPGLDGDFNLIENFGGTLASSGVVTITAQENAVGVGVSISPSSAIYVDAAGEGAFTPETPGVITIDSKGDIQVYGTIESRDEGSTITLTSEGMILVDGLVKADKTLTVNGGDSLSGMGLLVTALLLDGNDQRIEGGTLDVNPDGTIVITSVGDINIKGVVGQTPLVDGTPVPNALTIDITSTTADVMIEGFMDAADSIFIQANSYSHMEDARVRTYATNSTLTIDVLSNIFFQRYLTGFMEADLMILLVAPSIRVDGLVRARSANGRVLVAGEVDVTVGGELNSGKTIDVYAGIDPQWSLEFIQGAITEDQLSTGSLLAISGLALLDAPDTTTILSGGNLYLESTGTPGDPIIIRTPIITTANKTFTVVAGYQQVAIGTIQIPEITWETTTIEETVGTELVDVGDRFYTMSVTLEQIGYYNPNAAAGYKIREFLIEGVDYFNANDRPGGGVNTSRIIPWASYGVTDSMTSNYQDLVNYRAFSQLNDVQREAVLAHLGYKPLFDFSYTNPLVHVTEGVNSLPPATWTPDWASNADKIYLMDVDGWRDRYIQMPEGASGDVLQVEFFGETEFLIEDTTRDGSGANGTWINGATYAGYSGLKGEYAGRYQDRAQVDMNQVGSTFDFGNTSTNSDDVTVTTNIYNGVSNSNNPSNWNWSNRAPNLNRDDGGVARWEASLASGTGQRFFEEPGNNMLYPLLRDPNWSFVTTTKVVGDDNFSSVLRDGSRSILATADFINALNPGSSSFDTTKFDLFYGSSRSATVGQWGYYEWSTSSSTSLRVDAYQHINYGGRRDSFGPGHYNVGAIINDYYTSFSIPSGLRLTAYYHGGFSGDTTTWTSSVSYVGDFWNDEISGLLVESLEPRTFNYTEIQHDYDYNWESKWHDIYDQRIRQNYNWTSQSEDIFDFVEITQQVTLNNQVVTLRDQTVWEDQPINKDFNELVTERTFIEEEFRGGAYGEAFKSAQQVVIRANGNIRLSGKIVTGNTIQVHAGNNISLYGLTPDGADIPATAEFLAANTIEFGAGNSIYVDDSVHVITSAAGSSVAFRAAGDVLIGLEAQPSQRVSGVATKVTADVEITVEAGSDIYVGGELTASSKIHLSAGDVDQNALEEGGVTLDAEAVLLITDSAGDIIIETGANAGDVYSVNASFQAQDQIEITASAGTVTLSGGDLQAATLIGRASLGFDASAVTEDGQLIATVAVPTVDIQLSGIGDITVALINEATLQNLIAQDGGIHVLAGGSLLANNVQTLGTDERNDISIRTYSATGSAADLTMGTVSAAGLGDITLNILGSIIQNDGALVADHLDVEITTPPTLQTTVNSLSINMVVPGDVVINQSGRDTLKLMEVRVANGNLTVTADGSVELVDVVLFNETNSDGTVDKVIAIDTTSAAGAGDILIHYVAFGNYVDNGDGSFSRRVQNGTDENGDPTFDLVPVTAIASQGDIILRAKGMISEGGADDAVDVIADTLDFTAGTGVTNLEVTANELTNLITTTGDISIFEGDRAGEVTRGLLVGLVQTAHNAGTTVTIESVNDLRVVESSVIRGDIIRLKSSSGNVEVLKPTSGENIQYTAGISFIAGESLLLYRYFVAPELIEYRAGAGFQFGETVETSTGKLLIDMKAEKIMIESGASIAIEGVLTASARLELISKANVIVSNDIIAGDGLIDEFIVIAQGTVQESSALGGDAVVLQDTGFINIQSSAIDAGLFEVRAAKDIFIDVVDTLILNGIIGGLDALNPAENIRIFSENNLVVQDAVVATQQTPADSTDGNLAIEARLIQGGTRSRFIAKYLDVVSGGGISLNTQVERVLRAESSVERDAWVASPGDLVINEADALIIDRVVAYDGQVFVLAGDDLTVHLIETYGDGTSEDTGHHVNVSVAGDLYIDKIEAAVNEGAAKLYSDILIDASGTIYELSGTDGTDGDPDGLRNVIVDLYAHELIIRGQTADDPLIISSPVIADDDDDDELEIDFTKEIAGTTKTLSDITTGSTNVDVLNLSEPVSGSGDLTYSAAGTIYIKNIPISYEGYNIEVSSTGSILIASDINVSNLTLISAGSIVMGGNVTVDTSLDLNSEDSILLGGNMTVGTSLTLDVQDAVFLDGNLTAGAVEFSAGTAVINGNLTAENLTMAEGTTLGGNGTINAAVTLSNNMILGPGNSPGDLTVNGSFKFNSSNTYYVEVNGSTSGSLHDQLTVDGTVALNNASLSIDLNYVPDPSDSFVIIDLKNPNVQINGVFENLDRGMYLLLAM